MTTSSDIDGLTDDQLIERVATEVMGWDVYDDNQELVDAFDWQHGRYPCGYWTSGEASKSFFKVIRSKQHEDYWNPLTDWNHLREIENKVLSNTRTAGAYVVELKTCTILSGHVYDHELNARARCLSALKALSPSSNA